MFFCAAEGTEPIESVIAVSMQRITRVLSRWSVHQCLKTVAANHLNTPNWVSCFPDTANSESLGSKRGGLHCWASSCNLGHRSLSSFGMTTRALDQEATSCTPWSSMLQNYWRRAAAAVDHHLFLVRKRPCKLYLPICLTKLCPSAFFRSSQPFEDACKCSCALALTHQLLSCSVVEYWARKIMTRSGR